MGRHPEGLAVLPRSFVFSIPVLIVDSAEYLLGVPGVVDQSRREWDPQVRGDGGLPASLDVLADRGEGRLHGTGFNERVPTGGWADCGITYRRTESAAVHPGTRPRERLRAVSDRGMGYLLNTGAEHP